MALGGGGVAQTQKEKSLKLDFSKKKEDNLPIAFLKSEKLPEVKLELENKESKLDVPTDLLNYSNQVALSKVKDILSEIEKESRVKKQKQQIQNFESLAKSVKKLIPKVFDYLIPKEIKLKEVREEVSSAGQPSSEQGAGHSSTSSSEGSASVEMSPPAIEGDDRESPQVQQLEEAGNCTIDSSMEEILQSRGERKETYYSVSCINEDTEEHDFGNRWGGAFPRMLFSSQGQTNLSKLDIKVKIDYDKEARDEDYLFSIEFESDQFKSIESSKIIGDFKYEDQLSDSNSTGAIVKLIIPSNEQNIYLLMNLDENNK